MSGNVRTLSLNISSNFDFSQIASPMPQLSRGNHAHWQASLKLKDPTKEVPEGTYGAYILGVAQSTGCVHLGHQRFLIVMKRKWDDDCEHDYDGCERKRMRTSHSDKVTIKPVNFYINDNVWLSILSTIPSVPGRTSREAYAVANFSDEAVKGPTRVILSPTPNHCRISMQISSLKA